MLQANRGFDQPLKRDVEFFFTCLAGCHSVQVSKDIAAVAKGGYKVAYQYTGTCPARSSTAPRSTSCRAAACPGTRAVSSAWP